MRSSKSRSRSKSNRSRSLGNVVNRVFDSSGPEGKVRGTPQQIIDKYLTLARDAQLSNDRVAEQSFLQHAEHYTRMLHEAQREQAERQQQQQQQRNGNGNGAHANGQNGQADERADGADDAAPRRGRNSAQNGRETASAPAENALPDPIDAAAASDDGVVTTPENAEAEAAPKPRRARNGNRTPRARKKPDAEPAADAVDTAEAAAPEAPAADTPAADAAPSPAAE